METSSRRTFLKCYGLKVAAFSAAGLLAQTPLAQEQAVMTSATQPAATNDAIHPDGDRPVVGAIRWDAWIGARSAVGKAVEESLGPMRWHGRLPFYTQVLDETQVRIDCVSPSIMDQEIAYARRAGLDYWAFVTYSADDPMMQPLQLYLASERRHDINFCLIIEYSRLGNRNNYNPEQLQRYVDLMARDTYQKVLSNRPLLYILGGSEKAMQEMWGGDAAFKAVLDKLREMARLAGLATPYIVLMGEGNVPADKALADSVGYDALSCYAMHNNASRGIYADLAQCAENYWDRCRDAGAEVVPTVMTSWDRRPRIQHPVPWEANWQKPMVNFDRYYELPSPTELAVHLRHALTWVNANPKAARSRAVIAYAWNEHDEGGWLAPTLGEGTARIDAFSKVLGQIERSGAPNTGNR